MQNSYEFSQLPSIKKEILGTDIKAFLNQDDFRLINKINQVFGNTLKLNKNKFF